MTKKIRIILHVSLAVALLLIGVMGFKLLKSSRVALGRQQPEIPLPLVRTVPVNVGTIAITITGEGTVQALAETQIVPQVSGKIVQVSKNLVNGGAFKKDELLLTIEPRDYEIAVTLAEAGVKDAESKYEMAVQESEASIREWKRIHPDTPPPPLVAKEPQLAAARANLDARQANLEKARLDLARTRISAPFDGRVSAEQVDLGQYVTPGQAMATLYSTDAAEIVVPMENDDLRWISVPGFTTNTDIGAAATVKARVAGREMAWKGRVERVEGKINEKTRMVNLVIRVPNPYATQPPLAIGQFVAVEIEGNTITKSAVIPRAALHDQNTVYAVDPEDSRMYFRSVEVARMDERGVVVQSGIKDTDLVVVSPLKAPTDGMRVRYVNSVNGGQS